MDERYTIDRDTRTLILKYVRKYDEYKRWMEGEKERITSLSSVRIDGTPPGTEKSDTTGMAAEKLEKLETSHRAAVVKAIDHARRMCGMGMEDRAKETLTRCIWTSCLDGKQFPFEAFAGIVPYERRQFYRIKNDFLNTIRRELGL